jgi:uncharacterized protein YqgV (UPF0045/DUF77 family)
MQVSAQVSVYPMGVNDISPAIEAVWGTLEASGLPFSPGAMSTVVEGASERVFAALQKAFDSVAGAGAAVMVVTVSNACPRQAPESE